MIWSYFLANEEFTKLSVKTNQTMDMEIPYRQKPIPHVTIARFKKPHYYFQPQWSATESTKISIRAVGLWQSGLHTNGAKYDRLEEFTLG